MLQRYHGEALTSETDCSRVCTGPEDWWPSSGRLIDCLRDVVKNHSHKQGHDGAYGYAPEPPIAWSNGPCGERPSGVDVGLGLNRNLDSNFVEFSTHYREVIGMHIKPGFQNGPFGHMNLRERIANASAASHACMTELEGLGDELLLQQIADNYTQRHRALLERQRLADILLREVH